jgi:crotonobetaine/carnitine-CoA ligase
MCSFDGGSGENLWKAAPVGSAPPVTPAIRESDLAAVLYTSGTTSAPKGVQVTHANYGAVGSAVSTHLGMTAGDRWLIALPLFHANAQYYCTMSALVTGASIVLAPRFSASRWASQAADHGATLASLFAAPARMILANPPDSFKEATRLRAVIFAQNLSDEQAQDFESRFHTRLLQIYGMTETVLPATMNPNSELRQWDSIGQPLPNVQITIADDEGRPVPVGSVGELRVRGELGSTVASGYFRRPEATASVFGDGEVRTGDLARADIDGFVYFVDRAKDMIKRAGENVAATEVERVISAHEDVTESAVIGMPDAVRDEAIVAYVVFADGHKTSLNDLTAWCGKRLAAFKVPERFVAVQSLPRTSVGKIRKQELRAAAIDALSEDDAGIAGGALLQRSDDREDML